MSNEQIHIPSHIEMLEIQAKTNKDTHMNTLDAIIQRTLNTIDKNIDRHVGDMTLIEALDLMCVLMDIRDRQHVHTRTQKVCANACIKKPKRSKTDGL